MSKSSKNLSSPEPHEDPNDGDHDVQMQEASASETGQDAKAAKPSEVSTGIPSAEDVDNMLRKRVNEAYERLMYALTKEPTKQELCKASQYSLDQAVAARKSL